MRKFALPPRGSRLRKPEVNAAHAVEGKAEGKNVVHSIEKAFRVLEAFTHLEPELLLSEVGRRALVDNATAFRMLNTLVLLGYVEKVEDTKRFRLTLKCLQLGFNAIARMDLRSIAKPILQKLVARGAPAASLGVLDRGEVVYIERLQLGMNRLSVDIRVGTRIPAYSSAIGRAILAYLPDDRQRAELESRPREKLTPNTLTDLRKLRALLKDVRRDGIALVDQESVVGLTALAAPIFGSQQSPVAAISLAAASSAIPASQFRDRFARPLLEAAAELSESLQAAGGISEGA